MGVPGGGGVVIHNTLNTNAFCERNACIIDKTNTSIEAPYIIGFRAKKTV